MQRQDTKLIKDIIDSYIVEEGLSDGLMRLRIFEAWDSVVGLNVARATYDKFYRDGKFFCRIRSSAVRSQLSIIKKELVASMNKQLGREYINEIVLR